MLNEYILECLIAFPLENHSQLVALLFFFYWKWWAIKCTLLYIMNYNKYLYGPNACTIWLNLSCSTSYGSKYPRQTVHINHRVQADSAYNSILFMRPRGINVSLFSVQRKDLFYCIGNGNCKTVCSFLFTLGKGSLGLSCSPLVTTRNSNVRAWFCLYISP